MSGFWKCVLYAAALALLAHPLGQAIPGPFDPEKRLFRSRKWEQNGRVYTKLAIDKWKKLVPDMSRILPDMVKKELPGSGAVTADQAAALVQETCRAELVHGASCLLGLAFLWLWPGWGGAAVVLVSHSMEEIARNVDRIVVLSDGKVYMEGTPKQVFARAHELEQVGLDVPQVTKVAAALKARGLDIDTAVYTVEALEQKLLTLRGGASPC